MVSYPTYNDNLTTESSRELEIALIYLLLYSNYHLSQTGGLKPGPPGWNAAFKPQPNNYV